MGRPERRLDRIGARGAGQRAVSPGSRSLGDVYLPLLGNGGYDAQHYDLTIGYAPATNTIDAEADLTLRATQGLSEFSLDFRGLNITSVEIDGVAATWSRDVPNSNTVPNEVLKTIRWW